METAIVCIIGINRDYIGIMEKKMETTILFKIPKEMGIEAIERETFLYW